MKAARTALTKPTQKTLPLWQTLPLALALGLMFMLSLAPFGYGVVALVSALGLYALLLYTKNAKHALLVAWAYGTGVWATGAYWLYASMHDFGGVGVILGHLLIMLMALIMGLFHGMMGVAFFKVGRTPLSFAALWVLQEWLKTWVFTGFPWLFMGYAFTQGALGAWSAWLGVLGVSFVSVLISACLFELLARRRHFGYLLVMVALLTLVIAKLPSAATPTGKALSVALVQGNIDQAIKWDEKFAQDTLQTYADLSAPYANHDIVLWPEAAIPMTQNDAHNYISAMSDYFKSHGTAWVFGIPYQDGAPPNGTLYNALMAKGATNGIYQKQNLVPFGEYIPLRGFLDILPIAPPINDNARGARHQAGFDVKGIAMASAICYEVAYPSTMRANANAADAGVLLTVSNDAWFG